MASYRYSNEMIRFVLERTIPVDPIPRGKKRTLYHETAELFNQTFPNLENPVGYSQIKYITDHFGNSVEFGNPKGNIIYHDPAGDNISNTGNNIPKPTQNATQGRKNEHILCPHCNGKGVLEAPEESVDSTDTSPVNTATPVTPYPHPAAITMGKKLYQSLEPSESSHLTPASDASALPTSNSHPRPSQFNQIPRQNSQRPQATPTVPPRPSIPEENRRSMATYTPAGSTPDSVRPTYKARRETATSSQTKPGVAKWTGAGGYNTTTAADFSFTPGTIAQGYQSLVMVQKQPLGVPQPYIPTGQNRSADVNVGMGTQAIRRQASHNQTFAPQRYQSPGRANNGGVSHQAPRLDLRPAAPTPGKTRELTPLTRPKSIQQAPVAATHRGSFKRSRPDEANAISQAGGMGYEGVQGYKPMGSEPVSKRRKTSTEESSTLVNNNENLGTSAGSALAMEPSWGKYLDNIVSSFFADEAGQSQNQSQGSMGDTTVDPKLIPGNEFQVDLSLPCEDAGPVILTTTIHCPEAQAAESLQLPDDFDIVQDFQDFLNAYDNDLDFHLGGGEGIAGDDNAALGAESHYPDILG
ncbi:hypothetical protein F4774DRAFT_421847 [Daldinia eschscholtzii]|nr:hypothetical protein F4774DRAFT_421847 [Daldinia eschscholtzii]